MRRLRVLLFGCPRDGRTDGRVSVTKRGYHFEIQTDDGFVAVPERKVNFRSSSFGADRGYFEPPFGEVGDYIRVLVGEGDVVGGFFVVKPEDFEE